MGDVLTDASPEPDGFRGGGGGVGRIGVEGDFAIERSQQRMQQREIVATRIGAGGCREIDDRRVGLGQRCLAQKKLRRKAFEGTFDEAVGVLGVDFAIDLDAQFVERSLGRERMSDVAKRILMMMQTTIFGQIDPPGQDMLSFMVAWRQAQQLRHAGRRRVVGVGSCVGNLNAHDNVFRYAIVDSGLCIVMPELVPGIHVFSLRRLKTWMAGTSPAMTESDCKVTSEKESGSLFIGPMCRDSCQELLGDRGAEPVILDNELADE